MVWWGLIILITDCDNNDNDDDDDDNDDKGCDNDVTMISDFVTNSYSESWDSSCQKL